MNKIERQDRVKRPIRSGHVEAQEEIRRHSQEGRASVIQATLSRGLREIGLLELHDSSGKFYYSLSETSETTLGVSIRLYILKVARAGFTLVLRTNLGEADILANSIDSNDTPEIFGTVAGADTLLAIRKDEETTQAFERDLSTGL